jgi:hypothetical protein
MSKKVTAACEKMSAAAERDRELLKAAATAAFNRAATASLSQREIMAIEADSRARAQEMAIERLRLPTRRAALLERLRLRRAERIAYVVVGFLAFALVYLIHPWIVR